MTGVVRPLYSILSSRSKPAKTLNPLSPQIHHKTINEQDGIKQNTVYSTKADIATPTTAMSVADESATAVAPFWERVIGVMSKPAALQASVYPTHAKHAGRPVSALATTIGK